MTSSLLVLCASAFFLVAAFVSTLVGESLGALRRFATLLSPRNRVRFWLTVAALPTSIAAVIVGVALIPASGPGGDHCLQHGAHHPHLCLDHSMGDPSLSLMVLAALVAARVLYVQGAFLMLVHLDRKTTRMLSEGCRKEDDVFVFPQAEPQGFTLGFFRPQVHISEGLSSMPDEIQAPVCAHERAHARHRDPLWRAIYPLLSLAHLPSTARAIREEMVDAQELGADQEAARELGDSMLIAEAIVALARGSAAHSRVPSFGHGNIALRVKALVESSGAPTRLPLVALAAGFLMIAFGLFTFHESIHHGLESILGALG